MITHMNDSSRFTIRSDFASSQDNNNTTVNFQTNTHINYLSNEIILFVALKILRVYVETPQMNESRVDSQFTGVTHDESEGREVSGTRATDSSRVFNRKHSTLFLPDRHREKHGKEKVGVLGPPKWLEKGRSDQKVGLVRGEK